MTDLSDILSLAERAYYKGHPILTDAEFDYLSARAGRSVVGYELGDRAIKATHKYRMYSLNKAFSMEEVPSPLKGENVVESPKLDGAAISLEYSKGTLVRAITRGDGFEGELITDKILSLGCVPTELVERFDAFITGEIVVPKEVPNARNAASGTLHLKNKDEVIARKDNIYFVAYGVVTDIPETTYTEYMRILYYWGFRVIAGNYANKTWLMDTFPTDGIVYRVDDNALFDRLGYTSKFPKGAIALKDEDDFEVKETILREVKWQVGTQGKVTPVAFFDPVVLDDATVTKATLHNAGFLEALELELNESVLLVTRSGGIIPKVIGKL